MGLTGKSMGTGILKDELKIEKAAEEKVVALGGNPNVGKSTVFNALTGLNQHTGNWPGKTVGSAQGVYIHKNRKFILVDIPGTYSLMANSAEEEVARDFILFGRPDATVIVVDATCVERNLNLVLQTLEITGRVVVCVNLMDEAGRKGITVDLPLLARRLGVPVVGTSAVRKEGLNALMDAVGAAADRARTRPARAAYDPAIERAADEVLKVLEPLLKDTIDPRWAAVKLLEGDETLIASIEKHTGACLHENNALAACVAAQKEALTKKGLDADALRDSIVKSLVKRAEEIARGAVAFKKKDYNGADRKIDKILTSKRFGIPVMALLLLGVFWITLEGANIPSKYIGDFLFWLEDGLSSFFAWTGAAPWVNELLVLGAYRTLAWVVSVMLPPMAIFFPLFTLMEDLGYLPRVAFNLDNFFKKACACGKQALTMCMGFGCNAAGVIGCRIIDSPRERLIATLTNNFVPCNGRFPTLIAIITMFFAGAAAGPFQSLASTAILTGVIILGVMMTLLISKVLSKTILRGVPSGFSLELPPYRKPQIGRVLLRSLFDRTLFVLGRAVTVAAPAGIVIWLLANIDMGGVSVLAQCAAFLDPFARLMGMDGYIIMAFILGFPANEIVVPIIIMSYLATGSLLEMDNMGALRGLLVSNGWTWLTAVNVMLFSLMHWPCATTCLTIKKETQSVKWTAAGFLVPTATGIAVCMLLTAVVRLFHLI
jgi:ferrous iron transport protein B